MRDLGIRARLVMLTAAAVTPLVLLLVGGLIYSYGDALERAEIDVRKTAEVAAGRLSDTFQDARARLDMIRGLAEVRRSSGAACDAFMTAIQTSDPEFVSIGLLDRKGQVVCRGQLGGIFALEDGPLFERVLAMKPDGFRIGTFTAGIVSGQSTVLVAMPLAHVRGEASGVIYAVLKLDHLLASGRDLSNGAGRSVLLMETSSKRLLARWPDPTAFAAFMPNHPVLPFLRDQPEGGVADVTDIDGRRMIFGSAPVTDADVSDIMLLVGEPRAATIAAVNFRGLVAVVSALVALGLAIVAAAWLGSEMLVRPMRRLVQMASRIGAGDFQARTDIETWQAPEFRELASTLDGMAGRLELGRRAEQAVAASETRYRLLAENTADMITCIGPEGTRTFVSGASMSLLGYHPDELLGKAARDIAHRDDEEKLRETAKRLRVQGGAATLRYRARHRDGHYVWVEASGRLMQNSDELVFAIRDASHRKSMEDHLEAVNRRLAILAATDDLTNLPNRRTFNEALATEVARCGRSGAPLSVILIDVDRFKAFNDGYGHQAGDECLRRVAAALGLQVNRRRDIVARYGGEEFVALLPEATLAGAVVRADAMRTAVRELDIGHAGSEHGRVTVSIGVACLPVPDAEDATAILLRQADQALYAAKGRGRDATEAFLDQADAFSVKQKA